LAFLGSNEYIIAVQLAAADDNPSSKADGRSKR
jgi:hypothetical protein